MASVAIKVPTVGESISEGIIGRWLKPDGASVRKGEPLFELETDKASQEIAAEVDGVLTIEVKEGETVQVGQSVGQIDPDGTPKATVQAAAKPAPTSAPAKAAPAASVEPTPTSPAVRRIASEEGIDPATVTGSGPGGRVTKGDMLAKVEAKAGPSAPATPEPRPQTTAPSPSTPMRLSGERIESRKRMSGIRQRIAVRLIEAQQSAAILSTFNEADMSAIMAIRARYKESFQKKHGVGLGFMSFFVKASIEALKSFPNVNSRIEGTEVVTPSYHDIGVAVSTERGLMVPVIRNADQLTFAGIEKAIGDYAKKARENTIAVDDLQGGTFTITNGGIFGSLLSTPILNPPQSGILGMHKIQERPIALNGQIVIRPMMYLALSYDHRLIDGREAVSFLVRVKECLEDPERLMLEV
jgi:2-oxoglutarate dehydrogenase E2 component (dihydrolipoamide succinyltransferase)